MKRLNKLEREWLKELLKAHVSWIGNSNNNDTTMSYKILGKLNTPTKPKKNNG